MISKTRRAGHRSASASACDTIRNYRAEHADGGDHGPLRRPHTPQEIYNQSKLVTGGWPRRVGPCLFVDDAIHGVRTFDRNATASAFGWMRANAKVSWSPGEGLVTQQEYIAELSRTADCYDAIEDVPHHPPVKGIYYTRKSDESIASAGNGALEHLLDQFRPTTPADRQLLKAMVITTVWGGPCGARPMFLIDSPDGPGAGKSKAAELPARIVGGFIPVSARESRSDIALRLLSPVGMKKRVVLADNVKETGWSAPEIEAFVTASEIAGKRMYVGEAQRPNLLTWIVTSNGLTLCEDLAQRFVTISVRKGNNNGPWLTETERFIDEHRGEILADIIAALKAPAASLSSHSRWATWEREVLCRLPDPEQLQGVILERQSVSNSDHDEGDNIEEFFADKLRAFGYDPDKESVRVPNKTAAAWYVEATGDSTTRVTAATSALARKASAGHIKRLRKDLGRQHGRGFIWSGVDAAVACPIRNDLKVKLKDQETR